MAQTVFPQNIISNAVNQTIDTFPQTFNEDVGTNNSCNALIYNYTPETPLSIKQIHYSFGELDRISTNKWGAPQIHIFARLLVLKGYKAELNAILFDPVYNPRIFAGMADGNGGNNVLSMFGPLADFQKNSKQVLVNRLITDVGSQIVEFNPPIDTLDDGDNITVILTPSYGLAQGFWSPANPVTFFPMFGLFTGGVNPGLGADFRPQPIFRTLSVRGCINL